jgi:small subunit ribosomal protein S3
MSSYFVKGNAQAEIIRQDSLVRNIINSFSRDVISIKIERSSSEFFVFVTTSNLSHFVDKNNHKIDNLVEKMKKQINDKNLNIKINLIELKKVFSNAKYIANLVSSKIESRTPFRVALRMATSKALAQREVKGIKIRISGRLDGSEISKVEKVSYGKIPLSTLTSIIDFSQSEAKATYGKIGVTV